MSMFSEDNGNKSSTRLNAFICTVSGCACAIIGVWRGTADLMGLAMLSTGIIGVGMGVKTWQKSKEQNVEKPK